MVWMILTDTHIIVWLASGDKRLRVSAREQLFTASSLVVSAVIAWEYCDLQLRGRLGNAPPFRDVAAQFYLDILPTPAEIWTVAEKLPAIHRDPVDRMLIAHALTIDATLATADANIRRYPVKTLW